MNGPGYTVDELRALVRIYESRGEAVLVDVPTLKALLDRLGTTEAEVARLTAVVQGVREELASANAAAVHAYDDNGMLQQVISERDEWRDRYNSLVCAGCGCERDCHDEPNECCNRHESCMGWTLAGGTDTPKGKREARA